MPTEHEKKLTRLITDMIDAVKLESELLQNDIKVNEAQEESLVKLAKRQELSSRLYQNQVIARKLKAVIKRRQMSLVATLLARLDN